MDKESGAKKRMPMLTMDEVLLLVDAYFRLKGIQSSQIRNDIVQELSDNMRKLPLFPDLTGNPEFRSVAGMNMCLANVGYIDPDNPSKFGHGSVLQKKVFDYYSSRKTELRKLANAINSVVHVNFPILPEYSDHIEGAILPSYHCYLEGTDDSAVRLKENIVSEKKTLCLNCGEDLSLKYGEDAPYLLEPHLRVPLCDLRSEMSYSFSDYVVLCPCCHKWAHLRPENYEIEQ